MLLACALIVAIAIACTNGGYSFGDNEMCTFSRELNAHPTADRIGQANDLWQQYKVDDILDDRVRLHPDIRAAAERVGATLNTVRVVDAAHGLSVACLAHGR